VVISIALHLLSSTHKKPPIFVVKEWLKGVEKHSHLTVRYWPNADNTGHVINAAVLLFQCKSIVAVSAIREWRTLPHFPRDRGR
jgi:hypothetical protein